PTGRLDRGRVVVQPDVDVLAAPDARVEGVGVAAVVVGLGLLDHASGLCAERHGQTVFRTMWMKKSGSSTRCVSWKSPKVLTSSKPASKSSRRVYSRRSGYMFRWKTEPSGNS